MVSPFAFNLVLIIVVVLAAGSVLYRARRPGITDSPWYWAFVFSAMALVGALAIAPKYDERQKRLEARYVWRQRMYEERVAEAGEAERPKSGSPSEATKDDATIEHVGYSNERHVPLRLLGGFLTVIVLGSGYMLLRRAAENPAANSSNAEH